MDGRQRQQTGTVENHSLGGSCCSWSESFSFWREPLFYTLVLLIGAIYVTRITFLPAIGEEPRWGRGAALMLETGDWIVLRQQGEVFPERPPMTPWSMAVASLLSGRLDVLSIRLPSVIGVLLTSLMLFSYVRCFTTKYAAFFAALAYATFFQVLQLGRHGESEALFTCFLSSSLMLWHAGYTFTARQSRGRLATWAIAFALAACAALAKGPQGPAYLIAAAGTYMLLVKRDWRSIVDWRPFVGFLSFILIVGSWQIPYFLMTDAQAVKDTWFGLAGDRFSLNGLIHHMIEYPIAIFVCLLPWSPLLGLLLFPQLWRRFGEAKPLAQFCATAILITFPTVWFAAAAQERYFMPLYPCFAALVGVVMETSLSASRESLLAKVWRGQAWFGVATCAAVSIGVIFVGFVVNKPDIQAALTPITIAIVSGVALLATGFQIWSTRQGGVRPAVVGAISLGLLAAVMYVGPVMNFQNHKFSNLAEPIGQLRNQIEKPEQLVSFGAVNARFAFYYGDTIEQCEWPITMAEVPEDLDYFVIMRYPIYEEGRHAVGRGRYFKKVPAELPFEWEPIGEVCCDRTKNPEVPQQRAIVGKVIRINNRIAERVEPAATESETTIR